MRIVSELAGFPPWPILDNVTLRFRFERRVGTFSRTVGLPQGTSDDSVQATYTNGSLEIQVAKPEQPQPKRISIGVGGSPPSTIESSKAG